MGNEDEIYELIEQGEAQRQVAETRMNKTSSRSHTIFMIEVNQKFPNDTEKKGILNLVDLAGSENVGKSGAEGETLEEACKINLSLSALGNVIHSLSSKKGEHIPYRDSKLTRILQESLGGNYKTSLIVTCSPHSSHTCETLSTLKFAQRAKTIQNKVKMNIRCSAAQLQRIIDQLREEMKGLRKEIRVLRKRLGIKDEERLQFTAEEKLLEGIEPPPREEISKKKGQKYGFNSEDDEEEESEDEGIKDGEISLHGSFIQSKRNTEGNESQYSLTRTQSEKPSTFKIKDFHTLTDRGTFKDEDGEDLHTNDTIKIMGRASIDFGRSPDNIKMLVSKEREKRSKLIMFVTLR